MGPILAIARHDLRLTFTDRSAVMWMFVLPVVFATFFGLVMGGGSPQALKVRLTLVDNDRSPVSRAFADALASERIDVVEIDPEVADTTEGKIRTLSIPAGFGARVLAGEQVTVRLDKDPDTSTQAALVAQVRITAAIARLIGRLVEAASQLPEGAELGAEQVTGLEPAADLVSVETRFAGRARVSPDGFAQSVPGNAVMFVLLVALTYGAASIAGERQGGHLRRLATAPLSRSQLIAGKLAGRLTMAWLQVTVYIGVGAVAQLFIDLQLGNLVGLWVVLLVFAAAVAPLGLAFGGLFTEPDRAANVGVIATIVMAAFGGCWWPLEIVSRPLQHLALAFPTGWAMTAAHGVVSFGRTVPEIGGQLLVLVGFGVVFTALAVRSLRVD